MTPNERVASQLRLDVVRRLDGGEHGALAVVDRTGARWVLKAFPIDRHNRLVDALGIAARLRDRGVPVPHPYTVGTTATAAYTLQALCTGEVPWTFEDEHARQMLELWEVHRDAAPEGSDWPERVVHALGFGDAELFAAHAPIRAVGGAAAQLLDEIVDVGHAANPSVLRRTDAMHADWHHRNLLTEGDRVTAVIDWESARRGDARYDLVVLDHYANRYAGSGVARSAAARVSEFTDAHVEPRARRLLATFFALHLLWFVSGFRAERMAETIDRLQQHVAPVWR
jgi:aminoglycoside phosphotransferase (APT) family kinase protein